MNTISSNIINNNTNDTKSIPHSIHNDLIYFKDDILKQIRLLDQKLQSKYETASDKLHSFLSESEYKLNSYSNKITELSTLITKDNSIYDKIESLLTFKDKTNDTLITRSLQIDRIEKELNTSIMKYDQFIINNILYPNVIGSNCKFKNLKEYIDYTLTEISNINLYKDKNVIDFKSYKSKLDLLIKTFQSSIDTLTASLNNVIDVKIMNTHKHIENVLTIYNDRLEDMRVENSKYGIVFKKETERLIKEWEKVLGIKKEIIDRVSKDTDKMNASNNNVVKMFNGYQKEFKIIKTKFVQLGDFVKDIRFRTNVNNAIAVNDNKYVNKELKHVGNELQNFKAVVSDDILTYPIKAHDDNDYVYNNEEEKINMSGGNKHKTPVRAESYLKKYIKGEIDFQAIKTPSSKRSLNFNSNNSNIYGNTISSKNVIPPNTRSIGCNYVSNGSHSVKNLFKSSINLRFGNHSNHNSNSNHLNNSECSSNKKDDSKVKAFDVSGSKKQGIISRQNSESDDDDENNNNDNNNNSNSSLISENENEVVDKNNKVNVLVNTTEIKNESNVIKDNNNEQQHQIIQVEQNKIKGINIKRPSVINEDLEEEIELSRKQTQTKDKCENEIRSNDNNTSNENNNDNNNTNNKQLSNTLTNLNANANTTIKNNTQYKQQHQHKKSFSFINTQSKLNNRVNFTSPLKTNQTITTSHITRNKPHNPKTKTFHASKSYTLFPSIPNNPSHNKTRNKHPPFLNNNKPITSPLFPSTTTTIPNPTALTFSIDKSITNFMLKTTRLTNTTTTTHPKPSSPPTSDLIHFNSLSKLLINIPKTLPKSKTNLLLTPTTINDNNPRTNINNNNN